MGGTRRHRRTCGSFALDATLLRVDPWDEMAAALAATMYVKPAGFVIDLGTGIATPEGYDDEVWSAQIASLGSGAYLLRRSRATLLSRYPIDEDEDDIVRGDSVTGDCTDGYVLSVDRGWPRRGQARVVPGPRAHELDR